MAFVSALRSVALLKRKAARANHLLPFAAQSVCYVLDMAQNQDRTAAHDHALFRATIR
jgi:hypothetical protein